MEKMMRRKKQPKLFISTNLFKICYLTYVSKYVAQHINILFMRLSKINVARTIRIGNYSETGNQITMSS